MIKLRNLNDNDNLLIEKWIACDNDHANKTEVGFWTENDGDRATCFAVEDELGTIFYVRAEKVLRLHCQFAPAYEIKRTRQAIDEFAEHIRGWAKPNFKQIIFESIYQPLIRFLHKRGYRASPNEQVKDL